MRGRDAQREWSTPQRGLIWCCALLLAAGCRTTAERRAPDLVATFDAPAKPAVVEVLPPRSSAFVADTSAELANPIRTVAAVQVAERATLVPSTIAFGPEVVASENVAPPEVITPQPAALELSLFDAIETALLQNPDLTILRQAEGVSVGALGVARTYPFNPFVQLQATPLQEMPGGGSGTVYHYVLVMQTIQLAHQQRYRAEAGLAALRSVRWNILQAELNNVAQTERLYFAALYQRSLLNLAQANAELNRQLLGISQKQLEGGQLAGADVAIVRLDAQATQKQAQLAEANYRTALLDLRRHLNIPLGTPINVTGELTDWVWSAADPQRMAAEKCGLGTDALPAAVADPLADLVAGRPDVLAARADLAAARANASLAKASRIPDLQIGPYYQRNDSGVTFWGFRSQQDIPVLNDGMPLYRQRMAELRQRQTAWEQLFNRAWVEAQAAVDRYERARRLLGESVADGSTLPEELRRLEQQFKANEVDVVRVVTSRTSLLQLRRAHLDLLNELAQAGALVTSATGVAPQSIVRLPSPK
jgi:cobalt-zinc-cadmium efflux system outer membrane protein